MDTIMDDLVSRLVATLAAKRVTKWEEDTAWRYLREMLPGAHDQFLQQIADRAQWVMSR